MVMPPRIPDDKRAAILADIRAAAGSCRGIGKRHDVSPATVRKIAKDAGVDDAFSRANTENATRARTADMKAERAQLAVDLLHDAQRLRERAWSKYPIAVEGPRGTKIVLLDLPPLDQVRNAYTALAIAVDKSLRIELHDADTQGLAAVDAWLRDMIGD